MKMYEAYKMAVRFKSLFCVTRGVLCAKRRWQDDSYDTALLLLRIKLDLARKETEDVAVTCCAEVASGELLSQKDNERPDFITSGQ